jgi:hypothetical protein
MSGPDCDKCSEHFLDCHCKTQSLNQQISQNDDHLAASIVSECREIMKDYPSVTKMKACYNLMYGVFNLFKVRGDPKHLKCMAKQIYNGLCERIDDET